MVLMRLISCHDGKLQYLDPQALSGAPERSFRTGLDAIDAIAPAGLFSRGAVHELLSLPQHGTPLFFAMILAASASRDLSNDAAGGGKAIVWCDPERQIYPPALAARGISLDQLFLLRPDSEKQVIWSVAECLRCKAVGAVVATPPRLSRVSARQLQLAAERGRNAGILLRKTNARDISCYAAATRWLVRPEPGDRTVQRWNVQLIHGHGGRVGETVILETNREDLSVRAVEMLAHRPKQASPRKPPKTARAS